MTLVLIMANECQAGAKPAGFHPALAEETPPREEWPPLSLGALSGRLRRASEDVGISLAADRA